MTICVCCSQGCPPGGAVCKEGEFCHQCQKDGCPWPKIIGEQTDEVEPVTPGPWETSDRPHSKHLGSLGNPKEWRYVQHNFAEAPYEGELSDEWGIYPPLGEGGPVALVAGESNARLIAASPDLLRLLRHARALFIPSNHEEHGEGCSSCEIRSMVRKFDSKVIQG